MSKPVQFFLRCDPDARFFYSVELHPDRESMLRAVAELQGATVEELRKEELEAVCLRYKLKGNPKLRRKHDQIGTMFFVQGATPLSTVVHEMTHAAIGWAKRARVNPLAQSKNYLKCPEERFARTMQFVVEQFYEHAPALLAPKAA